MAVPNRHALKGGTFSQTMSQIFFYLVLYKAMATKQKEKHKNKNREC